MTINHAIKVSAIFSLVIFGQRQKALLLLSRRHSWLRREVAKQFSAIINCAIAVSVLRQPRIIYACGCSGEMISGSITVEVESNTTGYIRQREAVTGDVNEDGRAAAGVAAVASA